MTDMQKNFMFSPVQCFIIFKHIWNITCSMIHICFVYFCDKCQSLECFTDDNWFLDFLSGFHWCLEWFFEFFDGLIEAGVLVKPVGFVLSHPSPVWEVVPLAMTSQSYIFTGIGQVFKQFEISGTVISCSAKLSFQLSVGLVSSCMLKPLHLSKKSIV